MKSFAIVYPAALPLASTATAVASGTPTFRATFHAGQKRPGRLYERDDHHAVKPLEGASRAKGLEPPRTTHGRPQRTTEAGAGLRRCRLSRAHRGPIERDSLRRA
jgi:hypothetical protein